MYLKAHRVRNVMSTRLARAAGSGAEDRWQALDQESESLIANVRPGQRRAQEGHASPSWPFIFRGIHYRIQ